MPFIEAPTTFYLGKRYDPESHRLTDDVVYYDSRDLTTHAVVVGMTGSGKTGLCITLLEEAILDNIPAIVIDPKGDITNLLLSFPDLRPEDFQQWVNVDDARRAGLDVPAYAADVAQTWRTGLQNWGIVPDRLRWLSRAAKYSIFTPGSDSGLPISILASLRSPREGWVGNEEANREKINGVVTALLALIGKNVEPVKDREHVIVANIFEYAWQRGIDLTLQDIILQVQKPPFDKLGVFPIDEYMPEKARFKLAMELNSIIAAPSFQSWLQGEPMDIPNLLYQPDGRARVSIFYIAHLSEAERLFIITLLLENMLGWMRTLSGTTSLRALLYIDEMFGYFPPYPKNPPTKLPLMRLLKQARAFGVGLILATQNPGDLDYKGLSNAGTWFIGRLQSEQDRARVMTGLESLVSADNNLNLKQVERLIADIEPRVFLMNNIHDQGGPILVHSRWAMSYLRGPLTRQQVQILMQAQRQQMLGGTNPALAQASVGAGGYASQPMVSPQQSLFAPQAAPQMMPPALPEMPTQPPNLPEQPKFGGYAAQNAMYTPQIAPPPPQFLPMETVSPAYQQNYSGVTMSPSQVNYNRPMDSQATRAGLQPPAGYSTNQPPVQSAITQYFIPNSISSQQAIDDWERRTNFSAQSLGGIAMIYKPVLLAQAAVRYADRKTNTFTARSYAFRVPGLERNGIVHWQEFEAAAIDAKRVSGEPFTQALYGDLTPGLSDARRLTQLQRELIDLLYNTARLNIPYNPSLGIYANPDGNYAEFKASATQAAREKRDGEIDKVTAQYERAMDKLEDKLRRKLREMESEEKELADRKREELFTTGEAILSLLKGQTAYTLSRATRAGRFRRQTKEDLSESEAVIAELQDEQQKLAEEFELALRAVNDKWAKVAAESSEQTVTPFKKDIQVEMFGIGWIPFWYAEINGQTLMLPAES
ncbi:MAG: DUF87 domain-containing protein [Burkholderiales bacterium]|nr:DUF87 domain-containing protein [Anaerolineae bacterium]